MAHDTEVKVEQRPGVYRPGFHNQMRCTLRKAKRTPQAHEAGQALVEFALSLLIVLMLIFGLIDFSRAVYTVSVVQWAAQQGARAGTIDPAQVRPAIEGRLVGLDLNNLEEPSVPPVPVNNIITVEVVYRFYFITPLIEPFARDGIPMRGEASMLIR